MKRSLSRSLIALIMLVLMQMQTDLLKAGTAPISLPSDPWYVDLVNWIQKRNQLTEESLAIASGCLSHLELRELASSSGDAASRLSRLSSFLTFLEAASLVGETDRVKLYDKGFRIFIDVAFQGIGQLAETLGPLAEGAFLGYLIYIPTFSAIDWFARDVAKPWVMVSDDHKRLWYDWVGQWTGLPEWMRPSERESQGSIVAGDGTGMTRLSAEQHAKNQERLELYVRNMTRREAYEEAQKKLEKECEEYGNRVHQLKNHARSAAYQMRLAAKIYKQHECERWKKDFEDTRKKLSEAVSLYRGCPNARISKEVEDILRQNVVQCREPDCSRWKSYRNVIDCAKGFNSEDDMSECEHCVQNRPPPPPPGRTKCDGFPRCNAAGPTDPECRGGGIPYTDENGTCCCIPERMYPR